MNPLTKPVLLAVTGLLLGVLFAAAALTNDPPFVLSQPLIAGSDSLHRTPFSFTPVIHFDQQPLITGSSDLTPRPYSSAPVVHFSLQSPTAQPLKPGVYQTRPYAMILLVPKTDLDDRCVIGGIGADSKRMPIIHPDQQAIPKTDSK